MTDNKIREPLFHVVKRNNTSLKFSILTHAGAIVGGLILCVLLCSAFFGGDPFTVFIELFQGNFGTPDRIWYLLRDTALLLGVGLALVPAFKMKFWNLGGNGQILMGCLACVACMHYMGGVLPDAVVIIFMIITSMLAGAIWAVIPALFKAKWKTNESLFTLMMNYIAAGLVLFAIDSWVTEGSGILKPIPHANLPVLANHHLLTIIVVALMTVFMFFYLKKSKHGFELSIVGESENTARYVGIRVKKVVIRTLILSGAACGLIGLLIGGSIDHTVSIDSAKNMGFTGIMVAWLGNFNPIAMIFTSLLISFLSRGMNQVQSAFNITNSAVSGIALGVMYFCIIACEFFVSYRVIFRKKGKVADGFITPNDKTEEKEQDSPEKDENEIKQDSPKKPKKGEKIKEDN